MTTTAAPADAKPAMRVPFVDLRAMDAEVGQAVRAGIEEVLSNTSFIQGEAVRKFEEEFAAYLGAPHVVGVASGTDALHMALRACGIGRGDEVITVANTFIATPLSIWMAGARPVLVDIDPDTMLMDLRQAGRKIGRRTKAIVPVHLFGQPVDMKAVMDLARAHGLKVIEDACQSHGARFAGKRSGTFGDAGCYSFYPAKNLGCAGDGGAVVTSNPEIAARLKKLREYGQRAKYYHAVKGFNSRLDTLQAAVLRAKLPRLDGWNAARARHAARYNELLAGVVRTPVVGPDRDHIYHLYVIRTDRREELRLFLESRGVFPGIHYPVPVHRQDAFAEMHWHAADFPETDRAADEILSLPMYPQMTEAQVDYACAQVKAFFAQAGPKAAAAAPAAKPAAGPRLPGLSVVIPAFNEEANLEGVVRKALTVAREIADEHEVLVIDDGSRDRTGEIADRLAKENAEVRVFHHPFNIGYGGAQRSGLNFAAYEFLTFVPADGQFDVEDLRRFVPLIGQADVVLGVRAQRQDSGYRRLKTRVFRLACRALFGLTLRDINWVKMFRRQVLDDFDMEFRGIGVDAEVIVKAKRNGARFAEVEVGYHPRTAGEAKGDKPLNVLVTVTELLSLWWRTAVCGAPKKERKG